MMHDDDLDRALAALPLEEPPAHLHARILAATARAGTAPTPPVSLPGWWEVSAIGLIAALVAWLSSLVLAEPGAGARLSDAVARIVAGAGLTSAQTWLWLAIGGASALWISTVTVPRKREARAR
jgi:hypothetical protein